MKLYSVSDEYIRYLRNFDKRVYDNKEETRITAKKYLGIVLKINNLNYYIPMLSPKKGTLRLSNMIPVPESELILYEPKLEKNKNYKILIEKELEFIGKNENMIKRFAKIIYNQKINNYNVSYIKNVVNFKLLEQKCKEYK